MYWNFTDYANNKREEDAIVYIDAFGNLIKLKAKDFSSKEEFEKWKAISDEDYHDSEAKDNYYAKETFSIEVLNEHAIEPGDDDHYFVDEEKQIIEEIRAALFERIHFAFSKCTNAQQRRLTLFAEGKSSYEIAELEGTTHQSVLESLYAGKKKFLKNF